MTKSRDTNSTAGSHAEQLHLETAKIGWRELQRFFASGKVLFVAAELDLIQVADQIAQDNVDLVSGWMKAGTLSQVRDEQALSWYESDAILWSVVVKPWILVQEF